MLGKCGGETVPTFYPAPHLFDSLGNRTTCHIGRCSQGPCQWQACRQQRCERPGDFENIATIGPPVRWSAGPPVGLLNFENNQPSRLEGLNKLYGTTVLVGEATYAGARDRVIGRPVDIVQVKGRSSGVKVYELLALVDENDDQARKVAAAASSSRRGPSYRSSWSYWSPRVAVFTTLPAAQAACSSNRSASLRRIRGGGATSLSTAKNAITPLGGFAR